MAKTISFVRQAFCSFFETLTVRCDGNPTRYDRHHAFRAFRNTEAEAVLFISKTHEIFEKSVRELELKSRPICGLTS